MLEKRLYFRLLNYVKPYWLVFIFGLLFTALLALTEPAIPYLLNPLLQGTFVERDPDYLFWSPILLLLLFLIRGISSFLSKVAFSWVAGQVVLTLRKQIFARLVRLPIAFFDAHASGNLIAKVIYDVNQVTTAATRVLVILVRDSLSVFGLMAYMIYLNWHFTLLVSVLLPLMLVFVRLIAQRMRRSSRALQQTLGQMTHALEESIRGNKIVKVFGGESYEQARFNHLANWVRRYQFKLKVADASSVPVVEMIGALMIAILIYAGTGQWGGQAMNVGEFVAFFTAMGLLFSPIKRLAAINQPLQTGLAGAESVFDLLDQPIEQDQSDLCLDRVQGHIRYVNVHFRYPESKKNALHRIDLDIPAGQTLALVGPSGSGKTSLVNLLPRFYEPSSGWIELDGIRLEQIQLASLRQQIAYVGQESILFNDTVLANIAYGQKNPDEKQVEIAAKQANAWSFIEQLPQGLYTMISEDGTRLSGGQRQRIAIARALFKNAPILILDEATSALDSVSERAVQDALDRLMQNRTTLIIAHRLSTIEKADRIVVLKQGRIVEIGTHHSLLNQKGEYARLYYHQNHE